MKRPRGRALGMVAIISLTEIFVACGDGRKEGQPITVTPIAGSPTLPPSPTVGPYGIVQNTPDRPQSPDIDRTTIKKLGVGGGDGGGPHSFTFWEQTDGDGQLSYFVTYIDLEDQENRIDVPPVGAGLQIETDLQHGVFLATNPNGQIIQVFDGIDDNGDGSLWDPADDFLDQITPSTRTPTPSRTATYTPRPTQTPTRVPSTAIDTQVPPAPTKQPATAAPPLPTKPLATDIPPPADVPMVVAGQIPTLEQISRHCNGIFPEASGIAQRSHDNGWSFGQVTEKDGTAVRVKQIFDGVEIVFDLSDVQRVEFRQVIDRERYPVYGDSFKHVIVKRGEPYTINEVFPHLPIGAHVWIFPEQNVGKVLWIYCNALP